MTDGISSCVSFDKIFTAFGAVSAVSWIVSQFAKQSLRIVSVVTTFSATAHDGVDHLSGATAHGVDRHVSDAWVRDLLLRNVHRIGRRTLGM